MSLLCASCELKFFTGQGISPRYSRVCAQIVNVVGTRSLNDSPPCLVSILDQKLQLTVNCAVCATHGAHWDTGQRLLGERISHNSNCYSSCYSLKPFHKKKIYIYISTPCLVLHGLLRPVKNLYVINIRNQLFTKNLIKTFITYQTNNLDNTNYICKQC